MTVLTRLLGAAPAPTKSPSEQIAELDAMSADAIAAIALGDADEALRVAAIAKLPAKPPASDALIKLSALQGTAADAALARAAQQRLARLLDDGSLDFDGFMRSYADTLLPLSIASMCNDATRVHHAIAAIEDTALLCKLAVEAPATKVRQLAAEALVDPADLRQVLKDARAKDKNVYKIVKGKLDAMHAEEKAVVEKQTAIAAIAAALERHVHHPLDNLFVPTLEHLVGQWTAVAAEAPGDVRSRAEPAIERCRQIVAQHQHKLANEAARVNAIAHADDDRQTLLSELHTLLSEVCAVATQNVDQQLARMTSRWIEIAGRKAPGKDDKSRFEQLSNAVAALAQFIAKHGSWAQVAQTFADTSASLDPQPLKRALNYAALLGDTAPPQVAEAATALQAWEHAREAQHANESHALRQITGLIRKALGTLNAGHSRQAAGLRRAIEEKLGSVPHLPAHVTTQLQTLDEKLSVIQDWRSYVVVPKRQELIEQMEALIAAEEKPQALAEHIKKLQEEWKSVNKGAADHAEAEWQRFHEAAQKAYEPCREYFAAQSKMRATNLEKRKALLERVNGFIAAHNWEQPDWREVARALRESRQIWRAHQQVERAANKPVQAQFDTALADLQQRLDGEYARNVTEKKRLIARVQHLLTLDDTRKAIDEVKRLQADWKEIGMVSPEDSQTLWEEFRKHCDAVFAKKQAQFTEQRAAFDATKAKALEICAEVEQLATLEGADLVEGAKKLNALRDAFDAVGELPKANVRDINHRFDRAVQRVQGAIAQQRVRDKAQAWDRVLDVGNKIRLARLAIIEQLGAEEGESRKQAVAAAIEGGQWPKGALQILKAEAAKPGNADLAGNEKALRTLCIRAEIMTDTPTPSTDQAFRRTYQLQQLMQGMGYGGRTNAEELEAMTLEWVAIGATQDAVYFDLLKRFGVCRSKSSAAK